MFKSKKKRSRRRKKKVGDKYLATKRSNLGVSVSEQEEDKLSSTHFTSFVESIPEDIKEKFHSIDDVETILLERSNSMILDEKFQWSKYLEEHESSFNFSLFLEYEKEFVLCVRCSIYVSKVTHVELYGFRASRKERMLLRAASEYRQHHSLREVVFNYGGDTLPHPEDLAKVAAILVSHRVRVSGTKRSRFTGVIVAANSFYNFNRISSNIFFKYLLNSENVCYSHFNAFLHDQILDKVCSRLLQSHLILADRNKHIIKFGGFSAASFVRQHVPFQSLYL